MYAKLKVNIHEIIRLESVRQSIFEVGPYVVVPEVGHKILNGAMQKNREQLISIIEDSSAEELADCLQEIVCRLVEQQRR